MIILKDEVLIYLFIYFAIFEKRKWSFIVNPKSIFDKG